jgi:acyl-coenzyme A thioesterase PaaI-like protein
MFDIDLAETLSGPETIQQAWDRLSSVPGGRLLFSKLLGQMAPYTGTIKPYVAELREGFSRVEMKDRRRVRNHLNSIHAMALTNLSEVASGLNVMYSLPSGMRGILVGFEISYEKKARGLLSAESDLVIEQSREKREVEVPVVTRDEEGEVVTRASADWLVASQD